MICPSCMANSGKKVEMLRYEGLPPYLDLRPVARQHPLPIVRGFAEKTISQVMAMIENNIYYYKCRECGYIEIHERVKS